VTKRLQVLLEDEELAQIRRAARRRRQSVAEWVRGALRQARAADAGRPAASKLEALHASVAHEFPTGSIEEMNEEISRDYSRQP
jgi:hypothetical protein